MKTDGTLRQMKVKDVYPKRTDGCCRVCLNLSKHGMYCSEECRETSLMASSVSWQRFLVKRRDRCACCVCSHVGSWEMDHIIPVKSGGGIRPGITRSEILDNLRTLCHACHIARHAKNLTTDEPYERRKSE